MYSAGMGQHVAIYTRLSKDRTGRAEGVAAQDRRGRRYAAEHWPDMPVVVYCDNDASAADDAAPRKDYERLRADIVAGQVAAVWAVEQSRLTRSETGWFELAAELLTAGIDVVHTDRDGVVRLDEVAGIKAVLNSAEVRRLRRRVNDTLDDRAGEGRPNGGRSYGYRHVLDDARRKALEVVPEEAQAARWAAEQVVAGWSLSNIVRELTTRGAPTARGGKWATATVRSILSSPTIAGYRVHRGEIVGRGNWPPILDETTWRQVTAILSAPRDVATVDGRTWHVSGRRATARRYLLTGGTVVCGRDGCGMALIAQHRRARNGDRQPAYLCHRSRGGCNGIGIGADDLERYVAGRMFDELESPAFAAALATDEHETRRAEIVDALGDVDHRRSQLAAMWARRERTQGEWATARAVLDDEQAALTAALAALPPPAVDLDTDAVRGSWDAMTLDEQRQLVDLFIERVTIAPAVPGTRRFDPGRVTIEWRTL